MTDTNELRKLLAAATPVPWAVCHGDESWAVWQTKPDGMPNLWGRIAFDDGTTGEYGPSCTGDTRDLIVAAVNGLPAMLAELDELRAFLADLREAMELLRAHGQPPDWLRQHPARCDSWERRYGALLAKHKETP